MNDHQANAELLVHLGRWLDGGAADDPTAVLHPDVEVSTPGGVAAGIAAAAAQAQRNHEGVTQHLFGNVLVEVQEQTARVGAEVIVTMLRATGLRSLGGRYSIRTVRTADGWRIRHLTVTPAWDSASLAA